VVRHGPLWPCSLGGRSRARVLDIPAVGRGSAATDRLAELLGQGDDVALEAQVQHAHFLLVPAGGGDVVGLAVDPVELPLGDSPG
jgi:hypothetical protein